MKDYSKENLDITHYRNGDPIPFVKSKKKWNNLTTGAYCYYDNDPEKGVLYNWYAVNDPRGLAPEGWKIPTIEELEQIDLTTGLPGGYRYFNGNYNSIGYFGYWWSSTGYNTNDAWFRYLNYYNGNANRSNNNKRYGFSVRCLKDEIVIGAPSMYQVTKEVHEGHETIPHREVVKDYTVVRHVMFYPKTSRVSLDDLKKFFTLEAIASFIQYDYIVRDCTTIKPEKNAD